MREGSTVPSHAHSVLEFALEIGGDDEPFLHRLCGGRGGGGGGH